MRTGPELAGTEEELAAALSALSNPTRIALLKQLRTPKTLREIEVWVAADEARRPAYPLSRQAVREHLDRLVDSGAVTTHEAHGSRGPTIAYQVNNQVLFSVAEDVRELANLRPANEPRDATAAAADASAAPSDIRGACLLLVKGLGEGRVFPLSLEGEGRWVLGRRRGADVPLDFDPFVSAENAVVDHREGRFEVMDMPDSRNGTTLNFRRLRKGVPHPLAHGDVIGLGRTLLLFRA